jgi:hypothetical protein
MIGVAAINTARDLPDENLLMVKLDQHSVRNV